MKAYGSMQRSYAPEILDGDGIPAEVAERAYRDICLVHRLLGNTAAIIAAVKRDPLPVRRVLDVGCGQGGILREIQRRLSVEVVGVDLKPPLAAPFRILQADAVHDSLPKADVAISLCLAHHLRQDEVIALIRNVGRSCRRFVILDLVRHRLPLILFRIFAPLVVSPINVADGCQSIRRAYTPGEFRATIDLALAGSGAKFRHTVNPFSIRQIADINWRG
jgi:SAM-dependent methyltransferase